MSSASTTSSVGKTPMTIDWTALIAKHGFTTILAGAAVWFIAQQIVIPMRDDQKRFMDSVIETNKQHATAAAQSAQIQQTQATTLATLVDQQKSTTMILQQIRDDQRSGAWLRSKVATDP